MDLLSNLARHQMLTLRFNKLLPILSWGKHYQRHDAIQDATAALIVTLMLMPQALAYAMLSGLPPQVGLYASMLPLVVYAFFGTSNTLAIGPVAVAALMTASAIQPYAIISPNQGLSAAMGLAILIGFILLFAGLLKLGFLAYFLSHAVISGFISATSVLIALSQLPSLMGMRASEQTVNILIFQEEYFLNNIHLPSMVLALIGMLTLVLSRQYGEAMLLKYGCQPFVAKSLTRAVPALLIALSTLAMQLKVSVLHGVATIGNLPAGLPSIGWPHLAFSHWQGLWLPALLIATISYIESIAVARQQAMQRHEWIQPNQELIALGVANITAGLSAGLPVAGGLSRSVVNQDAGAKTPAAGLLAGLGVMFATYFFATWLGNVPKPILSATLLFAVLRLFDISQFQQTWELSKQDFIALCVTFLVTLFIGVGWGIGAGVMISIGVTLYKTSRPHIVVVGQVPGTQQYKNIARNKVNTCPHVVTIRIDEQLFFANIHYLEQRIHHIVSQSPDVQHLVLMCSAINHIDANAFAGLASINQHLTSQGIGFHLSEVKGPVMDLLNKSPFYKVLNGQVFLTQHLAYEALACHK